MSANQAELIPLDLVIQQVKSALDQYQGLCEQRGLPWLSVVEFDFSTTISTTVGGTINLFLFKFGGSHEKDQITDISFQYAPPLAGITPNPQNPADNSALTQALLSAFLAAAAAVKGALGESMVLNKASIGIDFGITWSGNAGISVPVSFVTVGVSGEKGKKTVQSVNLTFGK